MLSKTSIFLFLVLVGIGSSWILVNTDKAQTTPDAFTTTQTECYEFEYQEDELCTAHIMELIE